MLKFRRDTRPRREETVEHKGAGETVCSQILKAKSLKRRESDKTTRDKVRADRVAAREEGEGEAESRAD